MGEAMGREKAVMLEAIATVIANNANVSLAEVGADFARSASDVASRRNEKSHSDHGTLTLDDMERTVRDFDKLALE